MKRLLKIYLEDIDDSILEKWKKKLLEHDMECDFYPNFSFNNNKEGYFAVKLQVKNSSAEVYKGSVLYSGFSFNIQDFNYKDLLNHNSSKRSLLQKIIGVEKPSRISTIDSVSDSILKKCKYIFTISWTNTNSTEMRTAMFSAAIITEIMNGVLYTPGSNRFYDKTGLVPIISHQIFLLENSFGKKEWRVFPFDEWK